MHHRKWYLAFWNRFRRDDFPMFAVNMILEFLMHSLDELSTIGLFQCVFQVHSIGVRPNQGNDNFRQEG
jgi:hypothetical protein